MVSVFFMYMLFASTFTLGKAALDYVDPMFFIGIRMIIAGILLLGYCYTSGYRFQRNFWKDWKLFLSIILFHIYVAYVLEFWSLQYVTSFKTCFFYNLSPFITALFSYISFSEKLTHKQWLGLTIGFVGFILVYLIFLYSY